jgi:uncharacterized protein YndB with AHSA1/START domain
MVAVKGEIVIDRPPGEVFDFVANAENEPRYHSQMRVSKKITDGPIGVGTSFRQEIMGRGKVIPMTTEFTEFDRPSRIAEASTWKGGTSTGEVTFEAVNDSTVMRWSWDVQADGVLRFLGPVVAVMGRRQERRIWTGCKQLLEAEAS